MITRRYGSGRSRLPGATTGEVFLALSRDEWAREKLCEVYRKIFEGRGVRKGSMPDHFVYVTPGKARGEINEVAAWIAERFGDPAMTVPATTPFGYLSGKYDGWITYFSALAWGGDREIAVDFSDSVQGLSWASCVTSRGQAGGMAPAGSPGSRGAGFLSAARVRGRAAAPSAGGVIVTPAPRGFVEKFFGIKPRPVAATVEEEEVEEEEISPGEEERLEGEYQERVSRLALRRALEAYRARRDEILETKETLSRIPVGRAAETRRLRKMSEEDEVETARVREALARNQREKLEEIRQQAERDARAAEEREKSTVEKYARPGGSVGSSGWKE